MSKHLKELKKRCSHARWDCACAWYADFTYPDPFTLKRKRCRDVIGQFVTREEVELALNELKVRKQKGLPQHEPMPTPEQAVACDTVASYRDKWLVDLKGIKKPSTIQFYRDHLKNHVVPVLGEKLLTDRTLTRPDCKQFARDLRTKKLARATMVGILTTLSAMLSAAVDDDDCPLSVNPAKKLVKLLRDPNESKSRRLSKDKYFTREEVGLLLELAKKDHADWYPFFLCGFRTGLRMGELLGLRWGDIDWRQSFIHVQHAWVRNAWTTPKSGVDRTVDMSAQLRVELRLWRRRQAAAWMAKGLTRPDLVFPSNARTPHDHSKVRKVFMAILKKADLRHRSLHAMRHSFISHLLQQGTSPAYAQKQAGHRSMDLTINVYGHFLPGANREAVDRLDDASGSNGRANVA